MEDIKEARKKKTAKKTIMTIIFVHLFCKYLKFITNILNQIKAN